MRTQRHPEGQAKADYQIDGADQQHSEAASHDGHGLQAEIEGNQGIPVVRSRKGDMPDIEGETGDGPERWCQTEHHAKKEVASQPTSVTVEVTTEPSRPLRSE